MAVREPVERGIVPTLARPGGNITGLSTFAVATVDAKLLELARELLPGLSRVAILRSIVDPPGAVENQESTARSLGLQLTAVPFSNNDDVRSVAGIVERITTEETTLDGKVLSFDVAELRHRCVDVQALIAPDTPLLLTHRRVIVQVAARRRLPAIYAFREPVEDGGLMGLYTDLRELGRRGALYVDKILKGARPSDLPVEQPTKMNFVVNLKTAKALGLAIPPSLLLRADQVIQ